VSAIAISGNHVTLEPHCPPAEMRLKTRRNGDTVMKARWRRGCGPQPRPIRMTATMLYDGCTGVNLRHKVGRRQLHPRIFPMQQAFCPENGESAFDLVQQRVFAPNGCALANCHGAGQAAGLDLRPGTAHVALVDVPASNVAAAAAGKLRVVPGHPESSFLVDKLAGHLADDEGDQMPLGTAPLTPNQLGLVKAWVLAGAPASGTIPAAPCLPIGVYEPAPPLPPPPPGGHQLLLEGPVVQPGQEEEGCLWIRAPNDEDMYVSGWEFSLNPGTHHFAITPHSGAHPPTTDVWRSGDIACLDSGGNIFGQQLAGSPQAPCYEQRHLPGGATLLPGGAHLGLNAHYYNEFDVPILF
jgi:hypothetical protein